MKLKTPVLILLLGLALVFFTLGSALAQETFRVRFSPPLLELELDPGDAHQEVIKFENLSSEATDFYPLVQDFVPEGETGGKRFLEPDEIAPSFSLSRWVTVTQEKITLQPGEKATVPFTITVPQDAEPGGHYGAVLLSTTPLPPQTVGGIGSGAAVAVASRTGPIILVRVSGAITEAAELVELSTDKNFYEYPPVNFAARVKNLGNVHLKPYGQITIKNQFGKTQTHLPINEKLGNVLPQSIRKFDSQWKKKGFTLGRFTAEISLAYGDSTQQELVGSISFWIIPWKVLTVSLLGVIIVLLAARLGIKKYNVWIIAKAGKVREEEDTDEKGNLDRGGSGHSVLPNPPNH